MRVFPFHKVMIVQKQRLRQYYFMQLSTSHVGKITKINIDTVAYTFFEIFRSYFDIIFTTVCIILNAKHLKIKINECLFLCNKK